MDAQEATRVMQNERDNLDIVTEVVKMEGLDVDFWRGELLESEPTGPTSSMSLSNADRSSPQ